MFEVATRHLGSCMIRPAYGSCRFARNLCEISTLRKRMGVLLMPIIDLGTAQYEYVSVEIRYIFRGDAKHGKSHEIPKLRPWPCSGGVGTPSTGGAALEPQGATVSDMGASKMLGKL